MLALGPHFVRFEVQDEALQWTPIVDMHGEQSVSLNSTCALRAPIVHHARHLSDNLCKWEASECQTRARHKEYKHTVLANETTRRQCTCVSWHRHT